jgi:hypothetical protein
MMWTTGGGIKHATYCFLINLPGEGSAFLGFPLPQPAQIGYLWRPAVSPLPPGIQDSLPKHWTPEQDQGRFPIGNGHAPGIAIGRGATGAGTGAGAATCGTSAGCGTGRLGIADFFLAVFFFADSFTAVGVFLPVFAAPTRVAVGLLPDLPADFFGLRATGRPAAVWPADFFAAVLFADFFFPAACVADFLDAGLDAPILFFNGFFWVAFFVETFFLEAFFFDVFFFDAFFFAMDRLLQTFQRLPMRVWLHGHPIVRVRSSHRRPSPKS